MISLDPTEILKIDDADSKTKKEEKEEEMVGYLFKFPNPINLELGLF